MAARSLSRTKRGSSSRRRGRSGRNSLSDDPDHSTSPGASSPEELPSTPESAALEEQSPQTDNGMTLADNYPPARSSDEKADPALSTDELLAALETATEQASSKIPASLSATDTQSEGLKQACSPVNYTHSVSTVEPTDDSLSPGGNALTPEMSEQNSPHMPGQSALETSAHHHASHVPTINPCPPRSLDPKYKTVSNETQELYPDPDAIPIMSGILQKLVKYHEETADFQEGDCLVTEVLKGMGVITESPDLTGYFDLAMRKRVKQELKKEQAGLESLQAPPKRQVKPSINCELLRPRVLSHV
jgi:hypothetical protein